MTDRHTPPKRPLADVLVAPILLLVLIAAACSTAPGDAAPSPSTTTADTTSVPETTETTSATTTTTTHEPGDEPLDLEIADDGWFPWVFPTPSLSWYEGGCPSPDDVARNFMANFFDDPGAELTSLSASDHPDRRRIYVHSRGEGGAPTESGTTLDLARVDLEIVDCDAWVIVSATSELVSIDSVGFGRDEDSTTVVEVGGAGTGFEALIDLRVHDESFRVVAEGFGMGGALDVQPFEGRARFVDTPIDPNLIVIAVSGNVADGAAPPFAAAKARCCDGEEIVTAAAPVYDLPALAVVGVESDDTLNVRSGPGVSNDVVAELAAYSIGSTVRLDEPAVAVGSDTWISVGTRSGDPIGWVNDRFVVDVESDDLVRADVLEAAFEIRDALAFHSAADRMAEIMGRHEDDVLVVSTDAFISDDDQRLSAADLRAAGSARDAVRVWGVTDGEGSPIEANIADHFADYAFSPALAATDRIGVDVRFRSSNTIDNLSDVFPTATIVELHHSGGTGEAADFEWATIRLAFVPSESGLRLAAVVTDNWTI